MKFLVTFLVLLVVFAVAGRETLTPKTATAQVPPGKPVSKLSSRLLTLANLAATSGLPATPQERSRAVFLGSGGPGSLTQDAGGGIGVEVMVTDTSPATVASLGRIGQVVHVADAYKIVTMSVQPSALSALETNPAVVRVHEMITPAKGSYYEQEEYAPRPTGEFACGTPSGNAISEGNVHLNANSARSTHSVTGAGIPVGVMSDSYNFPTNTPATNATNDVASDDLPGAANPCGWTTAVQVLDEANTSQGDEGRAMSQIVHDLAPGSPLKFATAFGGEATFATNVNSLRTNGAKVITDDVSYFAEPFYQEGIVGNAMNTAVAAGIPVSTIAANQNLRVGGNTWNGFERTYSPAACSPIAAATLEAGLDDCTIFGAGDTSYGFTLAANREVNIILQWNEPQSGASNTDIDLFLINNTDPMSPTVLASSVNVNSGAGNKPFEFINWTAGGTPLNLLLAVGRFSGTGTPKFKILFFAGSTAVTAAEYNVTNAPAGTTVGTQIFGHSCSPMVITFAAVDVATTTTAETFSSRGPCPMRHWGPVNGTTPAAALAVPVSPGKPDVAASDGGLNTFFPIPNPGPGSPPYRFYGTSAAAPHGAAVIALMLHKNGALTPAQIKTHLVNTATAMPSAGGVNVVGSGLINALAAVGAAGGGGLCGTPGPIYRRVGGVWQAIAGAASDVAAGAPGAVWAIGSNAVPGGQGIYQWNGTTWTAVYGGACKLTIDSTGEPWALQATNAIYRRQAGSWVAVAGAATDLAGGIGGAFYALGTTASPGGFLIYQWNGSGWTNIPGAAEQIAVGPDNMLWARQSNNLIYRWNGTSWTAIPGAARELAGGSEIWALGTNAVPGGFGIYQWNGSTWIAVAGGAQHLAVDSAGVVWALQ